MKVIYLAMGTLVVLSFLFMMNKGKKYEGITQRLKEEEFQLKDLFVVGFAWQELYTNLGAQGFLAKKIRTDIVLYYGEKYAEFYLRVHLAKAYTYGHLILCFFAILMGLTDPSKALLIFVVGLVISVAMAILIGNEITGKVTERVDEYLIEFPNVVTKLALMVETGMILRDAWVLVTESTKGRLKNAMEQSCEMMKNGFSDADAIYYFGQRSGAKEIKKFTSMIIQGMKKGNADLASILRQQSIELWALKRQRLLQKGEEAATKLIIPTSMMFGGIILVIIASAMSGMSL